MERYRFGAVERAHIRTHMLSNLISKQPVLVHDGTPNKWKLFATRMTINLAWLNGLSLIATIGSKNGEKVSSGGMTQKLWHWQADEIDIERIWIELANSPQTWTRGKSKYGFHWYAFRWFVHAWLGSHQSESKFDWVCACAYIPDIKRHESSRAFGCQIEST